MGRVSLEVADIFRDHGAAWCEANAGPVSLGQFKVMSAIEACRTAKLGGHVAACEDCGLCHIAYNSCIDRHYHIVFTLPSKIADIAYQNKAVIYDLLFKAVAETMLTIAADPKHLGTRIGITSVLPFFGEQVRLSNPTAFAAYLAPLKKAKWFVYSKKPFSGPATTLAYLGRYTHRVAIANSRLIKIDKDGIIFRYKDYRGHGRFRQRTMNLKPFEFIRRFLIHVLPDRFHRIRHYGLFANGQRVANLDHLRSLLNASPPIQLDHAAKNDDDPRILRFPCPSCGGRMMIIEGFEPGADPPDHETETERIRA